MTAETVPCYIAVFCTFSGGGAGTATSSIAYGVMQLLITERSVCRTCGKAIGLDAVGRWLLIEQPTGGDWLCLSCPHQPGTWRDRPAMF